MDNVSRRLWVASKNLRYTIVMRSQATIKNIFQRSSSVYTFHVSKQMFTYTFHVSKQMFTCKRCGEGWQREKREDLEARRSGCNNGSILFFSP
jgi:hypothetical protein